MALSPALLRRVLRRADQATKVACCLASKRLCEALAHGDAWHGATVHTLDSHAHEFLGRVRVADLTLVCSDVPLVEWFLDGLIAQGLHTSLVSLTLSLGSVSFPRHTSVMSCISEFTGLVHLAVECGCVSRPACLAFPSDHTGLRRLRTVRVTEHATPRKVEVYFDAAQLPLLEEVCVSACTCDILAQAWRLPSLRVVSYSGEVEAYEDSRLGDTRLASLSLDVTTPASHANLMAALSRAGYIDKLTLVCEGDVCLDTHIPARHLHLRLLDPDADLDLEYACVRCLSSLRIEAAEEMPTGGGWHVRIRGVGSWQNFQTWLGRTTVHIGHEGTVTMEP